MSKPDPDGMNDARAEWARAAVDEFQHITGTDPGDAIADLLCDLMHLCDRARAHRYGDDFEAALARARFHYEAETQDDDTGAPDGYVLRQKFKSDGSKSTGSLANDGRPFVVLRRLTADEADPSEVTGRVELFRIRFIDELGGEFTAWADEIATDWPD